jgi:zinc protease
MTFLQRLPTHERRLANGLTVIVREDHSAPVVAVVTHVKAGYFDEPDQLVGISHVLEHMYFKGTERRAAGEIARETKAAGGYLNAGTIYDRTSYYTVLPSSSLEQALDIQSDALQQSAIDDDELRRELLVIIQEAKRKLDNPAAVAQETLFETMFDVHRIRRWRIGSESMLRNFTRDDVLNYYRNLYRASNTILVIAGDVEADRAFTLAERYYGGMPTGEPVRDAGAEEPEREGFRWRELSGDIAQTYFEWGWRTPGTLHEDTPALDVLAVVLGQGRASRLYRHVRDAGVVGSISAYNYTPTTVGIFGVGAELDPPDTAAALGRTGAVLQDLLAHGVSSGEADRARNLLEARLLRRLETVEGQANLIADWQALGDWRLADDYLARILDVTPDQLHRVGQRYLDPDRLTLLLYRPRSAPEVGDEASIRSLIAGAGVGGGLSLGERDDRPAAAAIIDGTRLRPLRIEDDVRFYVSDGGAHIAIKPRRTAPLVSLALYCRGGLLAERDGTAGMTGLMMRTSVKGTRQRSGNQLAEETESLGAGIATGIAADVLDWSITLPSRHLERGLDLLLETALEPALEVSDAERERKITLSDLEQLRDDMYQYPLRAALAAAYGDHPYGFSFAHLERAIREAEVSALPAWHRDRVLRGAPYAFVAGDVAEPDVVAGRIAARIEAHVQQPLGLDAEPAGWSGGTQHVEERDKAQTSIVFAFPGPPRNHDDLYALQLMSSAIAGLGGRLFEELRSRRSLAYAISASPMPRWLGGSFIAYIGTSPDREEEARDTLLRELQAMTREPLGEEELERARRYMIGAWQIRQQTNSRQLADLAWALLVGRGLAELRDFESQVRAVTPERIRAAAERWLRPDAMVQSIIRGTGASR